MMETHRHIFQNIPQRDNIRDYLIFLSILSVIFSLIAIRGDFILAPPYAVSAYLLVFQKDSGYSKRKCLIATYLVVIASSDLLHLLLLGGLAGIIIDVIVVSAFTTFTDLTHPPAIALAIFSYIIGSPLDFTISSLLSLGALLAGSILIERYVK